MNNIFTDLREKVNRLQASRAKTAGKELLTAIEKEENNDARMWLIFSAILWLASAVTIYMGFKYYQFTFEPSFPGMANALATTLSVVVELAKVFLTYAVLSGIIFGWAFRNWSKFFAYCFGFALAYGAYWWSYTTSTEGIAIYAKETSTDNLKGQDLTGYIVQGTADITAQIAQIEQSNQQAAGMTTKKGKINWYGQQTISGNAPTLSNLMAQKAEREKLLTEQWQKGEGRTEARVNVLSQWVMNFGGYTEWAVLFCLLAMIFFDKDSNARIMETETAKKVTEKIKEHHAKLSAAEMQEELERAATMNGTYKAAPLGKR